MTLKEFFEDNPKVALAFSGGVDSAYLLYAAKTLGNQVKAYYVKTPFQPRFEYQDALRLSEQLGVAMQTLSVDILCQKEIADNPQNRCYFCKKRIFSAILEQAAADGYPVVIDGTNYDDDAADRLGMQALAELGIRSPLRECHISKAELRKLSSAAKLFTHNKPSYACLATRIPAGTPITQALLEKTERSEEFLRSLGFSDFRIRYLDGSAKIQVTEAQLPLLAKHRQAILTELKNHYKTVLLDLEVRQ